MFISRSFFIRTISIQCICIDINVLKNVLNNVLNVLKMLINVIKNVSVCTEKGEILVAR